MPSRKLYTRITAPDGGIVGKLQRRPQTLEGHDGCVNTISFTDDGDTLISGSDDRSIIMWDWNKGDPGPLLLMVRCTAAMSYSCT